MRVPQVHGLHPRTCCRLAPVVVLAGLAVATPTGDGLVAQEGERLTVSDTKLDSIGRRLETISPTSGPPGTIVVLRTGGMPAVTPLRIGVGAVRFGFEEIGQVMTDARGEFTLSVAVPAWAQNDRPHRFIVFDFYFVPLALSDPFHVTSADGSIRRVGRLVGATSPCPALQTDDGAVYALRGDVDGFAAGDRVLVEGVIASTARCSDATTTIEVRRVHGAGR